MKLSLAMIVKDETECLDNCLKSIHKYVDEIVIVWNGTNPETKVIMDRYNVKIVPFKWTGNFAEVRQVSFDATSNELVLWLDSDDTFEHPDQIPSLINQFEDHRLGSLWLFYNYEQDDHGNTTMAVWRERILRKSWFKWSGVVHEECLKVMDCIQSKVEAKHCSIKHHPAKDRIQQSGIRNLEISEAKYIEEHKTNDIDAFNVWNYAKSLNAMNNIDKALEIFREFVQITESDSHRYQAYTEMAKILRKTHKFDEAIDCDLAAIKLKPTWPYAYFGIARSYFCLEDWPHVIFYTELGFRCKDPSDSVPIAYDPMAVTVRPLEPLVYALVQEAKFTQALVATNKALEFVPANKYFLNFKEGITRAIERDEVEQSCLKLYDYIKTHDNGKLKNFAQALPEIAASHPVFVRLQNQYKSNNGWENKIVIYCGGSYEYWDPLSVKDGIGGSEEAVIYLSKYLAQLGWNVEVYNNCLDEGNYDGVLWQGIWKYDQNQKAKIFISWRSTKNVVLAPKDSSCYLWLHDVWQYDYFTREQLERVDKIFVLSKWHRNCLPEIPDDKFYITRNGIIPEQFNQKITRDPKACIYASSPDRGLDVLLKQWPAIRKEVPDAVLHVYYGFTKNYDEVHKNDQRMRYFKEEVLKLLEQPGVNYHGRVSHNEIAQAFLGCGLWLYPTSFTEISCITAMKAQAAGAIPITTNMAALEETVQHGIKVDHVSKDKMIEEWTKVAIKYLKNPELQEKIRPKMIEWAYKHFAWKQVAKEWSELFNESVHS